MRRRRTRHHGLSRDGIPTSMVLGIPVARLTLPQLLERIREAADAPAGAALRLVYVNAWSCNLFARDPAYRRAMLAADLRYVDGNGVRLAGGLAGQRLPPRMTGADWIHDLCRQCTQQGHRLLLLGGAPGVADGAARRLRSRHPGLQVEGLGDGFFSAAGSRDLVARINRARPEILVLGMGSPRQELWMEQNAAALQVSVIWCAGGVLDYVSGRVARAPRWMRALGLEWLGRLLIEPRRLAGRYLLGLPLFLGRAAAHGARQRLGG